MNKVLRWATVASLSVAALSACSSDKAKPLATTAATTLAGATAPTTGTASGSASVDSFCKEIKDLAAKLKAALADPSSADSAAFAAQAQKLSTDSAALIQANPADVQKITQCIQVLAEVSAPAAP